VAQEPLLRWPGRFQSDSSSSHELSSDQEQVGKREQGEELRAVLGEAAIAGLHMAELPLDHPERVLDLGPHFGNEAVDPVVERMQLAADRGLAQFKREAIDPGDRL